MKMRHFQYVISKLIHDIHNFDHMQRLYLLRGFLCCCQDNVFIYSLCIGTCLCQYWDNFIDRIFYIYIVIYQFILFIKKILLILQFRLRNGKVYKQFHAISTINSLVTFKHSLFLYQMTILPLANQELQISLILSTYLKY